MKKKTKAPRNPLGMVIASLILLFGVTLIVLGCVNFAAFGWGVASLLLLSGVSSSGLALMTLVTGKLEWILLDLLLPG